MTIGNEKEKTEKKERTLKVFQKNEEEAAGNGVVYYGHAGRPGGKAGLY